ncbi:Hypothetical protein D9617_14g076140 [Elsinoe fawcettii]|nr:Hypothetical protein D9617_14g076140 [Elsinoe fawcettii]
MENAQQQQQQRSPLDQMQFIFSKALECTASVFQAANQGGNREKAAATALRLKQMIPAANVQFHDALDELEAEVMQARFILQRELDNLRSKQASATTNGVNGTRSAEVNDIDMIDVPSASEAPVPSTETSTDRVLSNGNALIEAVKADPPKPPAALHIDTTSKPDSSDQPEITTGGMSAMDFDSLFNDPASATASNSISGSPPKAQMTEPPKTETTAAPQAQMQASTQDNNEDLSSLLPGLESYANAGNDTIDLSTPDAKKTEAMQQSQTQNQSQQQTQQDQQQTQQDPNQSQPKNPASNSGGSQAGEQRDTTFDDLMNFADFDLGSFGGGDGDFDNGGGSTFDESFFNVE